MANFSFGLFAKNGIVWGVVFIGNFTHTPMYSEKIAIRTAVTAEPRSVQGP